MPQQQQWCNMDLHKLHSWYKSTLLCDRESDPRREIWYMLLLWIPPLLALIHPPLPLSLFFFHPFCASILPVHCSETTPFSLFTAQQGIYFPWKVLLLMLVCMKQQYASNFYALRHFGNGRHWCSSVRCWHTHCLGLYHESLIATELPLCSP